MQTIDDADYPSLLGALKEQIRTARVRAALAVNRELVLLYHAIGTEILARQREEGWGTKIIPRLSKDLRSAFPEMKGLSARNLRYMRRFAASWGNPSIVQQLAAKIPWFHNCVLLDKVPNPVHRDWYARACIANGWSRSVLELQIDTRFLERSLGATTNFDRTLPPADSDLARQTIRDPYCFDFLALAGKVKEREIEAGLVSHIRRFLLELGVGFAFVGSQYPLVVDGREFRLDLLFYHLKLRCFVIIDLKAREFRPEDAGKMNSYLAAADDLLRHASDARTIGLVLCQTKSRVIAEYALRETTSPLGVAEFQLRSQLSDDLSRNLPSIASLEAEFQGRAAAQPSDDAEQPDEHLLTDADDVPEAEEGPP